MREKFKSCGYHVVMLVLALLWLIPLLWTVVISLSSNSSLKTNSQILVPTEPTLSNYVDVFRTGLAGRWFLNSMIVSITATIITVLICAAAGYAFAKLPFPGRTVVYGLTLAGMMVPKEAMFVPLFMMSISAITRGRLTTLSSSVPMEHLPITWQSLSMTLSKASIRSFAEMISYLSPPAKLCLHDCSAIRRSPTFTFRWCCLPRGHAWPSVTAQ